MNVPSGDIKAVGRTAALEEGAASVIYKPFDVEEIINIVESVLKSVVILVVDDHASDREILSQILMEKGYNVAGAADGNEAVQMVKDCHYNVILMDIKLPGRDGVSVFEEIHSINPEAKVIFMTGFALDDMVRQALEGGAYPVVYKPLEVQNVLTMVRQLTAEKVV